MTRNSQARFCTLAPPGGVPVAVRLAARRPFAWAVPSGATYPPQLDAELPRRRAALVVLLAAPFLAVLDAFAVLVAVPSIQHQLRASNAGVQLVIAGYVVAYAAFLITGGRLGDIHGHRKLLVIGLGLFSATSLLAAAAPNQEVLVLARFLQGTGAALMYPQTLALIRTHFCGRELASALAAFGVALGLAAVSAQLVSGLLLRADVLGLGWRSIFLVNLPVSVTASGLALRLVPESWGGRTERLDLAGVGLVTIGLLALVFPLTVGRELGWPGWTWGLLIGGGLVGGVFVTNEHRLTRREMGPLVSLDLFRIRAIVVGLLATLALYGGQLSLWLLLTLYLQVGLGLSPLAAGLVFAPMAVGFLTGSIGASRLPLKARSGVLTIGALGLAASTGALAGIALGGGTRAHVLALLLVLLLIGAGFGLTIPTLVGAVLQAVPQDHEGAASGVLVTAQQVAGVLGVAVSGVVFFELLPKAPYASAFALTLSLNVVLFLLCAGLVRYLVERK